MKPTLLSKTSLMVLAVSLVAACSAAPGTDQDAGVELVTTTEPGAEPVEEVVWGLPTGEPRTVDPFRAGVESESTVAANFCESTLRVNPDFSIGPGLATSAEFVDDTTFVITLRDDVTFWDGSPLTAKDALWSYRHTADPEAGGVYASAFRKVTSMAVTGPSQVTLTFTETDAQFRAALAGPAGVIVQRDFAEDAGRDFGNPATGVMCTGPFQFEKWRPGESITATAYPGYWDGSPKVKRLVYRFVADHTTLTSALRAGEIDGAYNVPVTSAASLRGSDGGRMLFGPSTASLSFGPTTDEGPAADPRLRTALDLAINKDALIDGVLRGYGERLKTFTPPLAWSGLPHADIYRAGYEALPSHEQDMARARELVDEAGAGSVPLTMAIAAGSTMTTQAATVVQDAAKDIGVTIELEQLQATEFSELFYDEPRRTRFDFVLTTGYIEVPGALYYAPEFVRPDGLFNWSGYDNPEAVALLEKAASTTDAAATARRFVAAQEVFAPDRLQVTLASLYNTAYLSDSLSGIPVSSAYLSSPWAAKLGGVTS
ncbi:ABC transporter substrate-binding protein [Haloechinothrix halophila]|uniref:ABC transporter substrate-binding protein n=1 Tax=Haloechinothrix halophila TaxID=1069073 RepID=UPI0004149B7F|nr:ABC transporter substrate-binding protein [Haloechinothrix halophila]